MQCRIIFLKEFENIRKYLIEKDNEKYKLFYCKLFYIEDIIQEFCLKFNEILGDNTVLLIDYDDLYEAINASFLTKIKKNTFNYIRITSFINQKGIFLDILNLDSYVNLIYNDIKIKEIIDIIDFINYRNNKVISEEYCLGRILNIPCNDFIHYLYDFGIIEINTNDKQIIVNDLNLKAKSLFKEYNITNIDCSYKNLEELQKIFGKENIIQNDFFGLKVNI